MTEEKVIPNICDACKKKRGFSFFKVYSKNNKLLANYCSNIKCMEQGFNKFMKKYPPTRVYRLVNETRIGKEKHGKTNR